MVASLVSAPALSKDNLVQCVNRLSAGKVLVVGDMLVDELVEGSAERISREAPVLILEHVSTALIPGGAANTANNIAALGGQCHAIGVCGQDDYAIKLQQLFSQSGITHSLASDPRRPTTVKTRILSRSHSFKQQLLRLDRISHQAVTDEVVQKLVDSLSAAARDYQAIVLSDYRAGVITDNLCQEAKSLSAKFGLKVIVDAQNSFERFQDVTLLAPNQPDAERAVGFVIDSHDSLRRCGEMLLKDSRAKAVLITRGAQGMALFEEGKEMVLLPVFNKSEVFDVSGAGDTVTATMALCLVTGANFVEAMALGNLAAGVVVRKPGTATCTGNELLAALSSIELQGQH